MSPPRVLIGVCTYQESQNIETLVGELRAALPAARVLVVDDNSPDGTAQLVAELGKNDDQIEIIVRQGERGLGSAIVAAMRQSVEQRYDFFINLDADLSHDPHQLPRLLERAVDDESLDVVIGSRYVPGGKIVGWPLRRRVMSKLVNRFATGVLRLPVNDCSGSMRCYRVEALNALQLDQLQCTGYAVLEEVLVKLHQRGSKMAEVPITFTERELGQSKLSFAEAVRSIRFMVKLAITTD